MDFAVHVALQKYGFHLPLARQERMFQREGLVLHAALAAIETPGTVTLPSSSD